jgi:uncharacterized protein (DUF1330 family)
MKQHRFEIALGTVLLVLFVGFWLWQTPGPIQGKLSPDEIARYLSTIEEQLLFPAEAKAKVLGRLRAWAEADDGKPFYMLNVMRYYAQLRPVPGAPAFDGTPEQANAFYERSVLPLLAKHGGYPLVSGMTQGKNLVDAPPAPEDWNRVAVVRYPSRRAFLSFLADPAYGPFEPFKMMAVELMLVPVSGDVVIPDMRFVVGAAFLIFFLAVGWMRAVRRRQQERPA